MKKACILLLLSLTLILQGCMSNNPYLNQTTALTTQSQSEQSPFIFSYSSKLARQLEGYLYTTDPYYLLLINKNQNQFGDAAFVPGNLGTLNTDITHRGEINTVDARVANALYALFAELKADNVAGDLRVTSGYRDYNYQSTLFSNYVKREQETISDAAYEFFGEAYIRANYLSKNQTKLTAQDAEKVASFYSAKAGTSEHQTGLCVDFILNKDTELSNELFENTEAFQWLTENAYRFGFILRYPKGKSDVTGFVYESWHYRYVGRDAAAIIHHEGLTLEEYVARLNSTQS